MMSARLVTFVHLSDTHLHPDPTFTGNFGANRFSSRQGVARMVEQINNLAFPVDFVLHTGDIMTDPETDSDYDIALEILGQINKPVYYLTGNHDRPAMLQRTLLQRPEAALQPHLDYTFTVNGVRVIGLDSHLPDSATGSLAPEQFDWLRARLSEDTHLPLVVALHHNVLPTTAPWLDTMTLAQGDTLHRLLAGVGERLRGVFYGHIHESISMLRDGVAYHSVMSGWLQTRTWYGQSEPYNDPMQEPGFNVVTLTTTQTLVRHYRIAFT